MHRHGSFEDSGCHSFWAKNCTMAKDAYIIFYDIELLTRQASMSKGRLKTKYCMRLGCDLEYSTGRRQERERKEAPS